jgi:hypothetical protein
MYIICQLHTVAQLFLEVIHFFTFALAGGIKRNQPIIQKENTHGSPKGVGEDLNCRKNGGFCQTRQLKKGGLG